MTLPQNIFNIIYPVGAIYITKGESSQSIFDTLGIESTWQKIEGRFILGSSSSYDVGLTGGESTHKLTEAELPSHNHSVSLTTDSGGGHSHTATIYDLGGSSWGSNDHCVHQYSTRKITTSSAGDHTHSVSGTTGSKGSGTAHNNMPPYHVCDIYERIS